MSTETALVDEVLRLESKIKEMEEAFQIRGVTGVWHYIREGRPVKWCATYLKDGNLYDTGAFDTPWEALKWAKKGITGEY